MKDNCEGEKKDWMEWKRVEWPKREEAKMRRKCKERRVGDIRIKRTVERGRQECNE